MDGLDLGAFPRPIPALDALADALDQTDPPQDVASDGGVGRYPYRVTNLQIDLPLGAGRTTTIRGLARNLGPTGMTVMLRRFVYPGTFCAPVLVTTYGSRNRVDGRVGDARYIEGSVNAYELEIEFDTPIDVGRYCSEALERRVLLIDGSANVHRLIEHYLKRARVEFLSTTKPALGLELAVNRACDLVLLDTAMPDLDDVTGLNALRQRGFDGAIVALATPSERARLKAAGFDAVLVKPFTQDDVLQVLRDVVREGLDSSYAHLPELRPVIHEFVARLRDWNDALACVEGPGDLIDLGRLARLIRGEAMTFGFESIMRSAETLERCVSESQPFGIVADHLQRLRRRCAMARSPLGN